MFFTDKKALAEISGSTFNKPVTSFDPITGYRWNTGTFRFVRIIHGELVVDNQIQINNYGHHASYNYVPKKPSPRTFRFVVLGDSFTNDLAVQTGWPERLQELLCSRPEAGRDIEVYEFSTDGGGLLNWYDTFKGLLLPTFEFDALIIADWGNDLERQFAVSHSTPQGMFWGTFDYKDRPRNQAEFEKRLPDLKKLYEIDSDATIEQLVERTKREAKPARMKPEDYYRGWAWADLPPAGYRFSPQAFGERYGAERMAMFTEMIEVCKERKIEVIYTPMPTRGGILRIGKEKVRLINQVQGEGLCQHFGLRYFDGYKVFADVDPQSLIDFYWLKYDGHWAAGASMRFATKLAEWIIAQGLIPGTANLPARPAS